MEHSKPHGPKGIAKRRKPEEPKGRPLGDYDGFVGAGFRGVTWPVLQHKVYKKIASGNPNPSSEALARPL